MGSLASVNGEMVPLAEAKVPILDTGFTFGDSVYETLRTYRGAAFAVDRHLVRLRASAARLGIDILLDDRALRRRLDELLTKAANQESYIRWIVSRGIGDVSYQLDRVQGPTIVMIVKPLDCLPESLYEEGVPVSIVSIRRNSPRALDPAIKSCSLLNNVLAIREAQAKGAREAILLNEHGQIAEGASSNVFVVRRGELKTPPLEAGILAGITRAIVIELAGQRRLAVHQTPLDPVDLTRADEAFLTSSLKELLPIATVDGNPVANGHPGPVTRQLLEAFRAFALEACQAPPGPID
jgi:branched-chain amino acid aminotransferase